VAALAAEEILEHQRLASLFKMTDISRHRRVETLKGYDRSAKAFRGHEKKGFWDGAVMLLDVYLSGAKLPTLLIIGHATRMLDTVAPVCLGTIERPFSCLDDVGEVPARID
jgi:hypothetical protein